VVGATTMAEIRPRLERAFAGWGQGDVPEKNIGTVAQQPRSTVYILDRQEAIQSLILVGNVAPPKANPDEPAIETMNMVLGGSFLARINMNLRENKHWSYGSFTFLRDAKGQRPFVAYAPVQTDKTKEALIELRQELNGILSQRPATAEEIARAKSELTLTLPGNWETMGAVAGSLSDIVTFGLDDRYFDTYGDRIRAQDAATVTAAAKEVIHPDRLVWVVVGDRSKVEAGIRELKLGEIRFIDADGKPIGAS
jgi:zinc protease